MTDKNFKLHKQYKRLLAGTKSTDIAFKKSIIEAVESSNRHANRKVKAMGE